MHEDMTVADDYIFRGGYPTPETIARAWDDLDLNRAVSMYRFFYPSVSIQATRRGNAEVGGVANQAFVLMQGTPRQLVFTPNSDTPYAGLPIDLSDGPMVMEIPPGPIMSAVNDMNQLWVADAGLPGPDAGKGGKHLFVGPDHDGDIPEGFHVSRSTTNEILVLLRAMPRDADPAETNRLMQTVKVYPLHPSVDWREPVWIDTMQRLDHDFTPVRWEQGIGFWEVLHDLIDREAVNEAYRPAYGELAAIGIEKGKPFAPDDRMRAILERASVMGHAQLAVESFADRRPERVVWAGRQWEWAVLQAANGTFDAPSYLDLYAREKWFYQAQIESPAMFRRSPGAGSLYWLGLRDGAGAYLDGGRSYRLRVPLPVPAALFWSITVYDAETRSEVLTEREHAALRSMFELKDAPTQGEVELRFGPDEPSDGPERWVRTIPGKGWFVYFRIYAPQAAAFDGTWRLPDFEAL